MKLRYLKVSYRGGKPIAAYFYLPRQTCDQSVRTVRGGNGLVTDYTADGRPVGIEITAPRLVTLDALNEALAAAQQPPATADDIAPLLGLGRERTTMG